MLAVCALVGFAACSSTKKNSAEYYDGPPPLLVNGQAYAPKKAPAAVHRAMAAANAIQHMPYQYGGGHGRASRGLDCSGSVSYVLRNAGLMNGSTTSGGFRKFGKSGGGKWITVFASDGHVFMTICGLRLDTSSRGTGVGPRFSQKPRNTRSFKVRHPGGY
ncbi:MAG: peptidoglycan endopeptidase [Verrucomicrobiota bacterium]